MAAVFLTDFGLARSTTGSTLTQTGELLGTPGYMSPEQALGAAGSARDGQLTPATDTWALGCVLYELLSGGRQAFEGDSPAAIIGAVVSGSPPPPLAQPAGPRLLVRGCLGRRISERWPDAGALRAACDEALAGRRPRTPAPRRGVWVAVVVAAAVAVGAPTVWWLGRSGPDRPAVTTPSAAVARAQAAWGTRHVDPRAAATTIEGLLQQGDLGGEWFLRTGLLWWSVGDIDRARAVWARGAGDAQAERPARLLLALQTFFHLRGAVMQWDAAVPDLESLARGTDRVARLARAALRIAEHRFEDAAAQLAGDEGFEAQLLRGYALSRAGGADQTEAEQTLSAGMRSGLPLAWALSERGLARLRLGRFTEAEADLEASLALAPENAAAIHNRGLARKKARGDIDGAIADYRRALELVPALVEAWADLTVALHQRGQFAEGLAAADSGLKYEADHARSHSLRGSCLDGLGRYTDALAAYQRAIDLEPHVERRYYLRARTLYLLKRHAEALRDFDRFLEIEPDDAGSHGHRAACLWFLRRPDEALVAADRALAIQPERTDTLYLRATVLKALGRDAEAFEGLNRVLELAPELVNPRFDRAMEHSRAGRVAESEADIDILLRQHPEFAEAWWFRSNLRARQDRHLDAIADLGEAIALEPANRKYRLDRSRLLLAEREWDAARADAEQLLKQDAEDPDAHYVKGAALYGGSDVDGARESMAQAVAAARSRLATARDPQVLRDCQWVIRGGEKFLRDTAPR